VVDDQHDRAAPPVGSVAEEAARLLDALGGWAERSGYAAPPPQGGSARSDAPPQGGSARTDAPPPGGSAKSHLSGLWARLNAERWDFGEARGDEAHPCPECGAAQGVGRAASCQVCPLCQGINLLRSVRPETVDRLADLASAVAASLRDVARERRRPEPTPPPDAPRPGRVQDIPIDDEDTQGVQA